MAYLVYDESRRGPLAFTPYKYGDRGPRILGMSLIVEATPSSVYTGGMANKRRVNITIDPDIHTEMQALLDSAGMDFSGFVEMLCVRFLGEIRPIARRLDEMTRAGLKPTDAEVKLLLLGMFSTAQLDMGKMMNDALEELDILQMDKALEGEVKKKAIHTKKPAKAVKPKA